MTIANYESALGSFDARLREAESFHMGEGKVHQTLRTLAVDLDRTGVVYAVVGGMALNAHGYRRETIDVDVLVSSAGLDLFRERLEGLGYLPAFDRAKKIFRNTQTGVKIEFLVAGEFPGDGMPKPIAFPDPSTVAENIDGVRVVRLSTLIELKLASGMTQPARRRDLADVQDLIRIRKLDETFADSLDPYVRPMYLTLLNEVRAAGGEETP